MPEGPVFLVGAVRSGTTMLRLMIDHHPQVVFPSEFEFVVPLVSEEGEWPPLDEYYEYLATYRGFPEFGVEVDKSLSYPDLCRSILEQKRAQTGKRFYGSTVHAHFNRLRFIWPDARYIHLIRDPRDVASSCVALGWGGNVFVASDIWIKAERIWKEMEAILPGSSCMELRYEDLLQDPRGELEKVCAFIGVPYDEAMMRYPEDTTYALPDARLAYQWKRKMPEFDIRVVEARTGEMLVERGYEPSGLPPLSITPELERKLSRQAQRERVKFRIRRFGFKLFCEEYISRKLHIRPWHRNAILRINDITLKYLK